MAGYDFEYVLFKSDFRYVLAGLILALAVFSAGVGYNVITGMMTGGNGIDVVLRIEYDGISEIHELSLKEGKKVFDALKEVAYVEYRLYEEGIEVTGINDFYAGEGNYWECVINGETEGRFDTREARNGDVIAFVFV